MAQVAEVGKQSETKPVTNGTSDVNAQLTAQVAQLSCQLAELLAENKRLRETPVLNTGAVYGIIPASGKYATSMKMGLAHGGQLIGGRSKMLDVIDEVTSGRLQAFLSAHPEVK